MTEQTPAQAMQGQSTVDYILVLAVALMIGLLVVGLTQGWPDFALNSRNQQAVTFWRDQVRPITITEAHYDLSDKKLYFTMQTQTDERLELAGLFLDGHQMSVYAYNSGGAHTPMCDLASCPTLLCSCDFALYPRRLERAITEDFTAAGIDPGCRQGDEISRLPINLVYYRQAEPLRNLSQNTTVDLVFDCQP